MIEEMAHPIVMDALERVLQDVRDYYAREPQDRGLQMISYQTYLKVKASLDLVEERPNA